MGQVTTITYQSTDHIANPLKPQSQGFKLTSRLLFLISQPKPLIQLYQDLVLILFSI